MSRTKRAILIGGLLLALAVGLFPPVTFVKPDQKIGGLSLPGFYSADGRTFLLRPSLGQGTLHVLDDGKAHTESGYRRIDYYRLGIELLCAASVTGIAFLIVQTSQRSRPSTEGGEPGTAHQERSPAMIPEERIENLERELVQTRRRGRWLLAIVGLCLAGLFFAWTFRAQLPWALPRVIRADSFVLTDEHGNARAQLTTGEEGANLHLLDKNGVLRAALVAYNKLEQGPQLSLYGDKKNAFASFGLFGGGARLIMVDSRETVRASLGFNEFGAHLDLRERGDEDAVPVVSKAEPGLAAHDMNDPFGDVSEVPLEALLPGVSIYDKKGAQRVLLGLKKDGPGLGLYDENGQIIWQAPR